MKTQVLICGAGPTGLSAALFLATRGHRVTIFDRNEARTDKSKAIGVQPGTLELFATCFGRELPREMVAAGIAAEEFYFHTDNGKIFPVRFASVPSEYKALLMLRQSDTERILEERLARAGVRVRRRLELRSFSRDAGGVRAVVGDETIAADFLLGCDGAHSAVRKQLGYSFAGGTYDGEFVLCDMKVRWPWPYDSIRTFIGPRGGAAFFPIKGDRDYRLILIPRDGAAPAPGGHEISFAEVKRALKAYVPQAEIELSAPVWTSRFRVHHRLTRRMGEGRVFLCGDAAHVHSPVGAQGMNTGIHDAVDVSWRLSEILEGKADGGLLEGFLRDRHRNAARVVGLTDLAFRTVFARESLFTKLARRELLPRLVTIPALQRRMIRLISEIDVARKIGANVSKGGE